MLYKQHAIFVHLGYCVNYLGIHLFQKCVVFTLFLLPMIGSLAAGHPLPWLHHARNPLLPGPAPAWRHHGPRHPSSGPRRLPGRLNRPDGWYVLLRHCQHLHCCHQVLQLPLLAGSRP